MAALNSRFDQEPLTNCPGASGIADPSRCSEINFMTRGARFCWLTLSILPCMTWADENQKPTAKPSDPTEISFEQLVKMEIPVVEAASKYKQKITEAPSSVTIVTSDEVK